MKMIRTHQGRRFFVLVPYPKYPESALSCPFPIYPHDPTISLTASTPPTSFFVPFYFILAAILLSAPNHIY